MRINRVILLIVLSAIIFSSCKKTNKQGLLIPSDAYFVLHVNGEAINEKLPWEEVKSNELFKKLYADTSVTAYMRSAMDNPDNTGIDIKKDLLIFGRKDSTGDYIAIEGTIKDASKFKQFNSEVHRTSAETEKAGIHLSSNDKVTASWNNERFIILMNTPKKRMPMLMDTTGDLQ